ncbi:MAG: 3-hydroxyacyl-CoA dehydrogenase family protein [Deltaproteobacteria bacterium]|nr:3-hydroxyacyl-CoA dehydrogenase family protein [Deltaproteobacteria bacterium]
MSPPPPVTPEEARVVLVIGVIGSGTMGHGIAQVLAQAGYEARLCDVDERLVTDAIGKIRVSLDKGVLRGKIDRGTRDAALSRIKATTSLIEAVRDADLVIEAVPEKLELKREIFATMDRAAPERAILATNTSSLSVAAIAKVARDPSRVLGMHFFNPVPVMKLLEIVRHETTSDAATATARALGVAIGKEPIVVRDVAGFASSRLGIAIGLEAMRMAESGVATIPDIDKAMKLGYGHPMGPLELSDLVGLDVRLAIADYLEKEIGPSFKPPELLKRMVQEGKLGKKVGEGFYKWKDGKIQG